MTQETGSLHEDFLRTFYKLVYMAKIHQDNNQLLMECLDDFMQVIGRLFLDDDQITIQISRGNIYLQDEKLRYRREIESLINNLIQYFEKRNLQGLRFSIVIQDTPAKEILAFSRTLNNTEQKEDSLNWLVEQLENQGLLWAEVVHEEDTLPVEQTDGIDPQDQVQKRKEKARQSYFYALDSIKRWPRRFPPKKRRGFVKPSV